MAGAAGVVPRLTELAPRRDELTDTYDVTEQLGAIIDGLLLRGGSPEIVANSALPDAS
ncbi:hypothetical protein [Streptomyces sp. NPDC091212]|uniref:hypothetical protein n=1 Tax=Streptomyces sp. NPDC091212 TaxID=3155191 RepID=UPI00344130CE